MGSDLSINVNSKSQRDHAAETSKGGFRKKNQVAFEIGKRAGIATTLLECRHVLTHRSRSGQKQVSHDPPPRCNQPGKAVPFRIGFPIRDPRVALNTCPISRLNLFLNEPLPLRTFTAQK